MYPKKGLYYHPEKNHVKGVPKENKKRKHPVLLNVCNKRPSAFYCNFISTQFKNQFPQILSGCDNKSSEKYLTN